MRPLPILAAWATLSAGSAGAHVGAVVSQAAFCRPPPPAHQATDGGLVFRWAPEEADSRYRIAWLDGDFDPTGRFTFYAVDHQVPIAVDTSVIDGQGGNDPGIGRVLKTTDGREARDLWVSCSCEAEDAGGGECDGGLPGLCADAGARWCDDRIEWDTGAVADGVYWIAAVNNDPPYHVYNTTAAPIRVAHGPRRPPVVIVIRPDGLGAGVDRSYDISALVAGEPPLTIDLAWGINDLDRVNQPLHPIASGLPAVPGPDGAFHYGWDV